MRVVLDTNILISACWTPGGLEQQVVDLGLAGQFEIATSAAIWDEYQEVFSRAKFQKVRDRSEPLLAQLQAKAIAVTPHLRVTEAKDKDDDCFLECALAAGAAYIVTGNLKDFPTAWPHAKILNARGFLDDYSIFFASAVP